MAKNILSANNIGGRYKIVSNRPGGAIAVYYAAYDMFSGEAVCVTGINKRRASGAESCYPFPRLRNDASYCAAVVHPDIHHVIDQFDDEDTLYVVSSLAEVPPLTEMKSDGLKPDVLSCFNAIGKVLFAVEYYHSNGRPGCFIRPGHVHLSINGEVQIDSFLDCRLGFFNEVGTPRARMFLAHSEAAMEEDLRCAGETISLLLGLLNAADGGQREKAAVASVVPSLTEMAADLVDGVVKDIKTLTGCFHKIEDQLKVRLSESQPKFSAGSRRVNLAAGEILFREGDAANGEAYIVERGIIQIAKKAPSGQETQLDLSRTGDLVGEMALIDRQPRMATARALEPSTLVVLGGQEFAKMLGKLDPVSRRLITMLSSRLRNRAREVAQLRALIGMNK